MIIKLIIIGLVLVQTYLIIIFHIEGRKSTKLIINRKIGLTKYYNVIIKENLNLYLHETKSDEYIEIVASGEKGFRYYIYTTKGYFIYSILSYKITFIEHQNNLSYKQMNVFNSIINQQ